MEVVFQNLVPAFLLAGPNVVYQLGEKEVVRRTSKELSSQWQLLVWSVITSCLLSSCFGDVLWLIQLESPVIQGMAGYLAPAGTCCKYSIWLQKASFSISHSNNNNKLQIFPYINEIILIYIVCKNVNCIRIH